MNILYINLLSQVLANQIINNLSHTTHYNKKGILRTCHFLSCVPTEKKKKKSCKSPLKNTLEKRWVFFLHFVNAIQHFPQGHLQRFFYEHQKKCWKGFTQCLFHLCQRLEFHVFLQCPNYSTTSFQCAIMFSRTRQAKNGAPLHITWSATIFEMQKHTPSNKSTDNPSKSQQYGSAFHFSI